jgi:pimeloyl-ACP methyl ester carboxylesterase
MGIRLIAYDRPGYGLSDRHRGRAVADAATDVAAVADNLGIDRFAVLGRSGGGPHALACAALLPDRVACAAALVSLAPRYAEGLDWFEGMNEQNVQEYRAAWRAADAQGPVGCAHIARRLARFTGLVRGQGFLQQLLHTQVAEADREILADPGIRKLLVDNFRQAADERNLMVVPARAAEGAAGSADAAGRRPVLLGWLDDVLAFSKPWGIRLDDIESPVLLWHGEHDVVIPVSHSRWLAAALPRSTPVFEPGSGHFGALVVLPSVLRWLRLHLDAT